MKRDEREQPVTALDLVWRLVRDARWRGHGLLSDVLTVYLGFPVYHVERFAKRVEAQIDAEHADDFRHVFPDATAVRYPTRAGVTMRLPIPEHARRRLS